MTQIQNFIHIEKYPGYDKIQNPRRLTVKELLPIGVAWEHDGCKEEIVKDYGVLSMPLHDLSGVAIVEGPFETAPQNRAYVINADGSIRFEIMKPIEYNTSVFSDVYYTGGVLCFFLSGNLGDFRLSVNELDGTILKVDPSR